jgi:hypothetical protein
VAARLVVVWWWLVKGRGYLVGSVLTMQPTTLRQYRTDLYNACDHRANDLFDLVDAVPAIGAVGGTQEWWDSHSHTFW